MKPGWRHVGPVALPHGRPRRARLRRGPEGLAPRNQEVGLGRGGGETDSLAAQRVLCSVVEETPHAAPLLGLDEVRAADARVSRGADTWPASGSVFLRVLLQDGMSSRRSGWAMHFSAAHFLPGAGSTLSRRLREVGRRSLTA